MEGELEKSKRPEENENESQKGKNRGNSLILAVSLVRLLTCQGEGGLEGSERKGRPNSYPSLALNTGKKMVLKET